MDRKSPDFAFEKSALKAGARCVVGVDEVGRGPLAGPVVAAAVRLDPDRVPPGLNDSKRLSRRMRERLAREIRGCAEVSVALAAVDEIDRLNILQASMLAMERAVEGLPTRADRVLVDGNRVPAALQEIGQAVVGGDARVLSIAAASIVAKVVRDALMVDLAQQHPGYGWEKNAGYPTRAHISALQDLGVTPHHRRSFAPVHKILYQAKSVSR